MRLDGQTISNAATLLSAMENPKRLVILQILLEGEMPVGQLSQKVGLSQSALSQHLSKLRSAKLVQTRRDAQTIYYFSHSEAVRRLLATLEEIFVERPAVRLSNSVQ
ncbi:helix-turn-helix transcriptional regulator [Agrobacterium larrymoorei]|uniref:ArsR/SmtB family transcription factor n=1 Tax=Agrobacterium larrymoorei TaxID=160699 RepID=UPI001571B8B9|nr:metalloregulator ArsR/SmtB family transcription factor [Agrobacterium larrymoorei]NTJ44567.1 helix-turn-helix transcriptional regulator [Agrobacterium larrymoorei]